MPGRRHPHPIKSILHPTDLSEHSEIAFVHALRFAVENKAKLYLFHVPTGSEDRVSWGAFPGIRDTLGRWGLIEPDSSRADVGNLGIQVRKLVSDQRDVVKSIIGFRHRKPIDLMVLATDGRAHLPWRRSVAEAVARGVRVPTMFLPRGARGCVSWEDGSVSLNRVLVPVAHRPRADAALLRARSLLESFGSERSVLTALHVGDEREFPLVDLPDGVACQTERVSARGDAARRILQHARSSNADLILMATEGRSGLLDTLRGSTMEQVLRRASVPVLALPALGTS